MKKRPNIFLYIIVMSRQRDVVIENSFHEQRLFPRLIRIITIKSLGYARGIL